MIPPKDNLVELIFSTIVQKRSFLRYILSWRKCKSNLFPIQLYTYGHLYPFNYTTRSRDYGKSFHSTYNGLWWSHRLCVKNGNCTTKELVLPPFRVSRKEEFSFTDITRSIKIRYVACYVMVKEWAGAKQQKDTGRIVSPPTGETTWDALRVYIYSTDTKLNLA